MISTLEVRTLIPALRRPTPRCTALGAGRPGLLPGLSTKEQPRLAGHRDRAGDDHPGADPGRGSHFGQFDRAVQCTVESLDGLDPILAEDLGGDRCQLGDRQGARRARPRDDDPVHDRVQSREDPGGVLVGEDPDHRHRRGERERVGDRPCQRVCAGHVVGGVHEHRRSPADDLEPARRSHGGEPGPDHDGVQPPARRGHGEVAGRRPGRSPGPGRPGPPPVPEAGRIDRIRPGRDPEERLDGGQRGNRVARLMGAEQREEDLVVLRAQAAQGRAAARRRRPPLRRRRSACPRPQWAPPSATRPRQHLQASSLLGGQHHRRRRA